MPIYKRCGRCGRRLEPSEICSCQKGRHREYNHTRKDKKEIRFYWTDEWEKAKSGAIAECDGIDIYSLYVMGILETGYTVHHIVPLKDDWNQRKDRNNLIYLTESNHKLIHKKMEENEDEKQKIIALLKSLKEKFKSDYLGGS